MSAINDIFTEYARMRKNGLDAQAALAALRAYIEPLNKDEKQQLAQHLRAWEAGDMPAPPPDPKRSTQEREAQESKPSAIRPLAKSQNPRIQSLAGQKPDADVWIACNNCGKKNRKNDVFCYSCGYILEPTKGEFDTKHLSDASIASVGPDFFGPDSILFIEVRDSEQFYEVRPQQRDQEIIIGRSTGNSAMMPDIDLAEHHGAEMGVSRLHLAMKYDGTHKVIQVYDLGSANYSYINGQKLHPKEQRILRHGDELRLGKIVLRAFYRHPGEEIH
jgi:hypothetical protein